MKKNNFAKLALNLLRITAIGLFGAGIQLAATVSHASPYAPGHKKIALLPFQINSTGEYAFLADSVFDMLSTRLIAPGKVVIIDRNEVAAALRTHGGALEIDTHAARRIGARLRADFVIFGTLTVDGGAMRISTAMVDMSGSQSPLTYDEKRDTVGAVIPILNLIAADMNEKMNLQPQPRTDIDYRLTGKSGSMTAAAATARSAVRLPGKASLPSKDHLKTVTDEIGRGGDSHREDWLLSRDASHYTIQLMGVYNIGYLDHFIKENKFLKENEIAIFRATRNGKPWHQLVYGLYPTMKEARAAISRLPESIRRQKPWVRRLASVQKEIQNR